MACALTWGACGNKTVQGSAADSAAVDSMTADGEGEGNRLDSIGSIFSAWETTTLSVPNGGKHPDLLTLMKALCIATPSTGMRHACCASSTTTPLRRR